MASFASITVASTDKTIIPWTVLSIDPSHNFNEFYRAIKAGRFAIIRTSPILSAADLESVYVGKDKLSSMSLVQKDLNVSDICLTFGCYVKFVVLEIHPNNHKSQPCKDAFTVMMMNQRRLCARSLPDSIVERTKKDKLFNDLLQVARKKGLNLASDQIESGKSYFTVLTSVLWYIDGHQSTLSARGCKIPELFQSFIGYNLPELSKHRKREHTNLSADKLQTYVSSLYDHLLLSWLSASPAWQSFKEGTEKLAIALDSYLSYMRSQNKKMKLHHDSSAMNVASVQLLHVNKTPSPCLAKLNNDITHKAPYEYCFVSDYAPCDRQERYRYVQELQKGLSRPCVLCIVSIGGPAGMFGTCTCICIDSIEVVVTYINNTIHVYRSKYQLVVCCRCSIHTVYV